MLSFTDASAVDVGCGGLLCGGQRWLIGSATGCGPRFQSGTSPKSGRLSVPGRIVSSGADCQFRGGLSVPGRIVSSGADCHLG